MPGFHYREMVRMRGVLKDIEPEVGFLFPDHFQPNGARPLEHPPGFRPYPRGASGKTPGGSRVSLSEGFRLKAAPAVV